ncbi:hypothetical protein KAI11_05665 [Candidatus Bathyarchaeota archaeon]|nr:hypothetical protein [Candidatus Bathyarchaeota archaeon]
MRKMSPRAARRMMQKMGMEVEEIRDATQVTIRTPNKEIIIDAPEVSVTKMQNQKIFQIMGGVVTEKNIVKDLILEEDVKLVAQQANVSIDAARKALEDTKGDLAQAILLLAQR